LKLRIDTQGLKGAASAPRMKRWLRKRSS